SRSIALTDDGSGMAMVDYSSSLLFVIDLPRWIRTHEIRNLRPVTFTDKDTLVSVDSDNKRARVISLQANGRGYLIYKTPRHREEILSAALTRDKSTLVTVCREKVRVFNLLANDNYHQTYHVPSHTSEIVSVMIKPDSEEVVLTYRDGTTRIFSYRARSV